MKNMMHSPMVRRSGRNNANQTISREDSDENKNAKKMIGKVLKRF